jgi:hypothetical protein
MPSMKKSAKKTAKKTPAKKMATRKTPARKLAAKKTARKIPARKAAVKRPPLHAEDVHGHTRQAAEFALLQSLLHGAAKQMGSMPKKEVAAFLAGARESILKSKATLNEEIDFVLQTFDSLLGKVGPVTKLDLPAKKGSKKKQAEEEEE